jgi:hypothetical protein
LDGNKRHSGAFFLVLCIGRFFKTTEYLEVYIMKYAKLGMFAAGVLFGTAGIKVLSSKDAKRVYAQTTAATIRAKESIMSTVTTIKENAGDVLADAKEINAQRAAEDAVEVVEDAAETAEATEAAAPAEAE